MKKAMVICGLLSCFMSYGMRKPTSQNYFNNSYQGDSSTPFSAEDLREEENVEAAFDDLNRSAFKVPNGFYEFFTFLNNESSRNWSDEISTVMGSVRRRYQLARLYKDYLKEVNEDNNSEE